MPVILWSLLFCLLRISLRSGFCGNQAILLLVWTIPFSFHSLCIRRLVIWIEFPVIHIHVLQLSHSSHRQCYLARPVFWIPILCQYVIEIRFEYPIIRRNHIFLPCKPISNLSSQFSPNNGCVSLFSMISIGRFSLLFSVLNSTMASPLHFIGFLLTSTKHFVVSLALF